MVLDIPRELDLRRNEDRRILRSAALQNSALAALIEENLEDYVTLFKDSAWRRVHPWGVEIMVSGIHLGLEYVLGLTRTLKTLAFYPGFCRLMAGFNSHGQVHSTLFEIQVAEWCLQRSVTKLIEFSPQVRVRAGTKRPDLLWRTTLGDVYCECKRPDGFDNSLTRLLNRLHRIAEEEYSRHTIWREDVRLDIVLSDTRNTVNRNIRNVVREAASRHTSFPDDAPVVDGPVQAIFRLRKVNSLLGPGDLMEPRTLSVASVTVGTTPVGLNDAHIRTSIDATAYFPAAAARLLREARRQLPADRASAIFIQLSTAGEAVVEKIKALLMQKEYGNTPWVGIWTPPTLYAAWRNGQPFDGRLLAERTHAITSDNNSV